jgi:hypothetical protein
MAPANFPSIAALSIVSGHEGVIVGPAGEAASAAAETASASSRKASMIGDDMI